MAVVGAVGIVLNVAVNLNGVSADGVLKLYSNDVQVGVVVPHGLCKPELGHDGMELFDYCIPVLLGLGQS